MKSKTINIQPGKCPTRFVAAVLACLLTVAPHLMAQRPPAQEHQVKAAYLFNFTQFVEWPAAAFSHSDAPLIIGVLGDDAFASYLESTVAHEKIDGRRLEVQRYRHVSEVVNCHLLFIGCHDPERIRGAMTAASGHAILTVGDYSNFMRQGGIVRFYPYDDKMRFQINLEAARSAGLVISSKLLRLADIYTP